MASSWPYYIIYYAISDARAFLLLLTELLLEETSLVTSVTLPPHFRIRYTGTSKYLLYEIESSVP